METAKRSPEKADSEERVQIEAQRQAFDLTWGLRKIGPAIESFRLSFNVTEWSHDEVGLAGMIARSEHSLIRAKSFIGVFSSRKSADL